MNWFRKNYNLHWLGKLDKSLPKPRIVFADITWCSGFYAGPDFGLVNINGTLHDTGPGLICISTENPEYMTSTLVHEWRHHWQRYNIGQFPEWKWRTPAHDENFQVNYDKAIKAWHEKDALAFEYKHARSELNEIFMEIICRPNLGNVF